MMKTQIAFALALGLFFGKTASAFQARFTALNPSVDCADNVLVTLNNGQFSIEPLVAMVDYQGVTRYIPAHIAYPGTVNTSGSSDRLDWVQFTSTTGGELTHHPSSDVQRITLIQNTDETNNQTVVSADYAYLGANSACNIDDMDSNVAVYQSFQWKFSQDMGSLTISRAEKVFNMGPQSCGSTISSQRDIDSFLLRGISWLNENQTAVCRYRR